MFRSYSSVRHLPDIAAFLLAPTLESVKAHEALTQLFATAQKERRCAIPLIDADISAVKRRVRTGEILRVWPGIVAQRQYWESLDAHEQVRHLVRALARVHPDWVFAGPTAAIMYGLDCSYRRLRPICIVSRPGTHCRNTDSLAHIAMAHPDVVDLNGVPVTDLLRTLFDCAAKQPLRYALGPLDSALRRQMVMPEVLRGYPGAIKYSRQRDKVRRAFDLADGRSENGGESEARAVLTELGYPPQDLQTTFPCLDDSRHTHRVDMLWVRADGTRLAGEFDGTRKYVDPSMTNARTIREVVDAERQRQRCLERQGVTILRMYYDDLDKPWLLQRRLEEFGAPHA